MHKGDCSGVAGKGLKCTHLHTSSLIFLLIMKHKKTSIQKKNFKVYEGNRTPVYSYSKCFIATAQHKIPQRLAQEVQMQPWHTTCLSPDLKSKDSRRTCWIFE